MPALRPFQSWAGPRSPRILFVGEAWGREEEMVRKPFIGEAGKELFRMLGEAQPDLAPHLHARISELMQWGSAWAKEREEWFEATSIAFTNTLSFRPQDNNLLHVSLTLAELREQFPEAVGLRTAIQRARYLHPQHFPELDRLWEEIETSKPTLIVPLGATALWALTNASNIGSVRGTVATTLHGHKMLPTWHPANILYNWSNRPIAIADLGKAFREAQFHEVRRPARRLKILPTLVECIRFRDAMYDNPPALLASDTETCSGQITTIGFAPSADTCFVIPFWDRRKPGWSYWDRPEDEVAALEIVRDLIGHKRAPWPVVWQNGVYDLQYIMKLGIAPRADHDTMLLHHSIFPEMQKSLGFLGSVYTSEPAWKLMRRRRATEVSKADE